MDIRLLQRRIDIGIYRSLISKGNILFQHCDRFGIFYSVSDLLVREGTKIAQS